MKSSNITFIFCILITILGHAGNAYPRNPCMDAISVLLGAESTSTPKYKFTPFADLTKGYKAEEDEFITITDAEISSVAFKEFIKSRNSSRLIINQDNSSEKMSEALNQWVKHPKIFFAVPDDTEGTRNVFSKSLDDANVIPYHKQMEKTHKILSRGNDIPGLQMLSNSNPSISHADEITKYINDKSVSGPVFVFAHNERGRLKFPDGSSMDITSFAELAYKNNKEPVVISCSTYKATLSQFQGVVTTGQLRFEDFALGLIAAQEKLESSNSSNCLYLGDYMKIFDKFFINSSVDNNFVKYALIGFPVTGGGLLIVGVVIRED